MTGERQSSQVLWAKMYGGPADGERVPIILGEPIKHCPYLLPDYEELYWYTLYRTPQGHYCYVLTGMTVNPAWQEHHDLT